MKQTEATETKGAKHMNGTNEAVKEAPKAGHIYSIPWGAGYIGCEIIGTEDGMHVGMTNWAMDGEPWEDGDQIVLRPEMWGEMDHIADSLADLKAVNQ